MEKKENNLPQKVDEITQKVKNVTDNVNTTANNIGNTLNKFGQTANNFNDLGKTIVESKKISSETKLGLKKIEENHKTINKHIDIEYKKQKQAMDKAENVIDSGLESGNIDLVKAGLDSMTGVANHNPMTDLKNHLDNKIEKDFEDDDFIIEI